ncbi:tyrosine-type recombinase/integrase [Methylocystis sp. IM2]
MKRVLQHTAKARFPARNRCLLMLSWLAGMRVAEIAALKLSDVLAPDGAIRAEIQLSPEQTKGSLLAPSSLAPSYAMS